MRRLLAILLVMLVFTLPTMGMINIYVDPSASGANDGTSWTDAYENLSLATDDNLNLVTSTDSATIWCRQSGATADALKAIVSGWTTSSDYRLYITQDPNEEPNGLWDAGHYTLGTDTFDMQLDILDDYVDVNGLQFLGTGSAYWGLRIQAVNYVTVQNCIFKDFVRNAYGAVHFLTQGTGSNIIVKNCLAYDCEIGFQINIATGIYLEHCTAVDMVEEGFEVNKGGNLSATISNCLADNCTAGGYDDSDGSGGSLTTQGIYTSDATSPQGAGYQNKVFHFLNEAGDDFHLDSVEDGNYPGADVSARVPLDVDGDTRSDFDAGFDELVGGGGGGGPVTYYVAQAYGNDSNDGSSWEESFATLSKLLTVLDGNDTAYIDDGNYAAFPAYGSGMIDTNDGQWTIIEANNAGGAHFAGIEIGHATTDSNGGFWFRGIDVNDYVSGEDHSVLLENVDNIKFSDDCSFTGPGWGAQSPGASWLYASYGIEIEEDVDGLEITDSNITGGTKVAYGGWHYFIDGVVDNLHVHDCNIEYQGMVFNISGDDVNIADNRIWDIDSDGIVGHYGNRWKILRNDCNNVRYPTYLDSVTYEGWYDASNREFIVTDGNTPFWDTMRWAELEMDFSWNADANSYSTTSLRVDNTDPNDGSDTIVFTSGYGLDEEDQGSSGSPIEFTLDFYGQYHTDWIQFYDYSGVGDPYDYNLIDVNISGNKFLNSIGGQALHWRANSDSEATYQIHEVNLINNVIAYATSSSGLIEVFDTSVMNIYHNQLIDNSGSDSGGDSLLIRLRNDNIKVYYNVMSTPWSSVWNSADANWNVIGDVGDYSTDSGISALISANDVWIDGGAANVEEPGPLFKALFADYNDWNFRQGAGSTLIDYISSAEASNDPVSDDILGNSRDSTPDIGAYEGAYSGTPPQKAILPYPTSGTVGVDPNIASLHWANGGGATDYNVMGPDTSSPPTTAQGNQDPNTYAPGALLEGTTYYFRIDANNSDGMTTGDIWNFKTIDDPCQPGTPSPTDANVGVSLDPTLTWVDPGSGDSNYAAVNYDVYFGTDATPDETEFIGNQDTLSYTPSTLDYNTVYYWKIDANNPASISVGNTWSFTTMNEPSTDGNGVIDDPFDPVIDDPFDSPFGVLIPLFYEWRLFPELRLAA